MNQKESKGFIPPHGGYKELLSYRKAEIVYDLTFRFCQRFLKKGDRTIDQMVQAARSGKQNIVEGSHASGTSKEMESSCSAWPGQAWRNFLSVAQASRLRLFPIRPGRIPRLSLRNA